MHLKKLMELQDAFDKEHSGQFNWSERITESNLDILEFLLICMIGELGELANAVKKVLRGDLPFNSIREELNEEVADVFIYLIKLCNQMNIDLEESFLTKLEKNRTRFKHFEQ